MAPKKRRYVPASLRAELAEYTHLLRSLRVESVQDLSKHVGPRRSARLRSRLGETVAEEHAAEPLGYDDGVVEEEEVEEEESRPKASEIRWPLMLEDVYVPQFTLADEVGVIARRVLELEGGEPSEPPAEAEEEAEVTEGDTGPSSIPEPVLSALATSTHDLLQQLLALLVGHRPAVAPSLQNRLRPFGWEDVLAAASVSGSVSPGVLERVRRRMGAEGDEGKLAIERLDVVKRSKDRLNAMQDLYEQDLFDTASLLEPPPEPTRPRKHRKMG